MIEMTRAAEEREKFLMIRNVYLTSARPIQSPEHLKGRVKSLKALVDALTSPGRHAFIYGFRGVGKSSLAQTTAFQLHQSASAPILIGCEPISTFSQITGDILRIALATDPLETKGKTNKLTLGGTYAGYGGNIAVVKKANFDRNSPSTPSTMQSHISKKACELFPPGFVVVIDEFDQLTNIEDHKRFALLLKQLSDQNVKVHFFSAIAESIVKAFQPTRVDFPSNPL